MAPLHVSEKERRTESLFIHSDVWERADHVDWMVEHMCSDWKVEGHSPTVPQAYKDIETTVRAAIDEAEQDVELGAELRYIRTHFDA